MITVFKQLRSALKGYLFNWHIPLLANLIPYIIYQLGISMRLDSLIELALLTFYINIFGTVISAHFVFIYGKWYFVILQILVTIFLFFNVSIVFTFSPPDFYGVHKEIPPGIDISEPLDSVPEGLEKMNNALVLTRSFQPGIYNYHASYKALAAGTLYIKAFEITSNDRLSGARIKEKSKMLLDSGSVGVHSGEFTIYEGDWGDKYAARIEVWFKPADKSEDFKIAEKNYIVEGWMR
jgi:hypothetical protein